MKNRKGFTWLQTLVIVLVLVLLLILLSPIKKAIERARIRQKDSVIYKGFVVRVTDDDPTSTRHCQRHLRIEARNAETSQGRMVFILACDFRRNTDPNNISFQVIDIRNVPEDHPILELATFKGVKEAYQHFRTEQARREKEKANLTKTIIDPRKLTNGPVP